MATQKITSFFPDKSVKQGYVSLFREMVSEALGSRWLTWQFFKRNFSATYKQSVLGILWALLVPLVSVGMFIYLNGSGILNTGNVVVPYPLYAVAGIALWQLFSVGLTLSANALVSAGSMITKINFARESLVVSAVAQAVVPTLIQIVVVFVLFGCYRIVPPWTALLVPLAVIPLLLLTLGLGFMLSVANGVMRDVGTAITALITFLIFLTPILYAKPTTGFSAIVATYNPLYYLVAVPRDLLIMGSTPDLWGFLYSTIFAVVVFLVFWVAFHLTEFRIAERI